MLLYFFCTVCLVIAYTVQRQQIKVMRARDRSDEALLILLTAAANLPEEVTSLPDWQFALRNAARARQFVAQNK